MVFFRQPSQRNQFLLSALSFVAAMTSIYLFLPAADVYFLSNGTEYILLLPTTNDEKTKVNDDFSLRCMIAAASPFIPTGTNHLSKLNNNFAFRERLSYFVL
jgi:hypothetical protein